MNRNKPVLLQESHGLGIDVVGIILIGVKEMMKALPDPLALSACVRGLLHARVVEKQCNPRGTGSDYYEMYPEATDLEHLVIRHMTPSLARRWNSAIRHIYFT